MLLFFLCTPALPAKIGLDPLMGDGSAGQVTALSGAYFEPSTLYTVKVNGLPVTPPTVTSDAAGAIPATSLSLPTLPGGNLDVELAGPAFSRTFTGAYRVQPNICVEPGQGGGRAGTHWQVNAALPVGGWAGMVFIVQGAGFASGAVVSANSITVGAAATQHPAITVSADGLLPSTTVLVASGLGNGSHAITINDGSAHTYPGAYSVYRTIGLSPARGSRVAGTAITITGWGFSGGATIGANSITVGGTAGNHPAVTVANGTFTVTLTTGAGLGNGSANDVVINDGSVNTFVGAYYSVQATNPVLAMSPVTLSGIPGESVDLQGLGGFGANIAANSIAVNEANGLRSTTTHPAITVGGGAFPLTRIKIDAPVPTGTNRLLLPGNIRSDCLTVVPGLSICPVVLGSGGSWTATLTGWGMEQGNPSIAANSIMVGGVATTHLAGVVGNAGVFGPEPVTVNAPLPSGASGIAMDDASAGTITFPGAVSVRRSIGLSLVVGPGTPGETVAVSGTGFTANTTVNADSITFGGTVVTHLPIYVGANGTFSATVMDLPTLNAGPYDVVAQGETFPAAYRVSNPVVAVLKYRNPIRGRAGDITTFSFSFTNTAMIGNPPALTFVLSDNLPPLTQYIPGSAQCSLAATTEWFNGAWTAVEPPAASVQAVRWRLSGRLPAGASGWASFQVQIQ